MNKDRHKVKKNKGKGGQLPINFFRPVAGLFAGLRFTGQTSEGCTAPRLLGCYEHELHPHIERLIGQSFDALLNIGCADGYYAVGLARRMPGVPVFAA